MRAQLDAVQTFVDQCVLLYNANALTPQVASEAKLLSSELEGRVVDTCVQLHGGAGYMEEYRICGMYTDARITRIFAGTSEIMKEIIGRGLGWCRGGRIYQADTARAPIHIYVFRGRAAGRGQRPIRGEDADRLPRNGARDRGLRGRNGCHVRWHHGPGSGGSDGGGRCVRSRSLRPHRRVIRSRRTWPCAGSRSRSSRSCSATARSRPR